MRRWRLGTFSSSSVTRTKSPCLKAWGMAKKAAAAQNQATTSFMAPVRTPNSRSTLCAIISTQISAMNAAPGRRWQCRGGRESVASLLGRRGGLAVGGNDGFTVRAGLLDPVAQHDVAHLLEVGGQLGRRRHDLHAFFGQGLLVPVVLLLAEGPAAGLGLGSCLGDGGLGGRVQRVEGLLVDDDRVLGQPGLRVV